MKKSLLFFTAALLVCACTKEAEFSASEESFSMKVNASYDETKTSIEYNSENQSYVPFWTMGDAIQVLEFSEEQLIQSKKSDELTSDCQTASFSVSLDAQSGNKFKYYAVYPSVSYGTGSSGSETFYRLNLPENQTFSATTFGSGSDLLISGNYEGEETERPTSVSLKFKRIGAIVGITVKGMNVGETIESVTISSTDQNLAGFSKYDPTSAEWLGTYSASKKSITTTPVDTYTTTGTDLVWFRTYGVTLETDLTISVITDKNIYTKTIDLAGNSKNITLKEGGMTKFAVNNLTSTPRSTTKYALVTDADNLNVGDKVIFVAKVSDGAYYAAGELSSTYLTSVSASLDKDGYISADGVVEYTLGKNGDYWVFSNGENLLGTNKSKDLVWKGDYTTWDISISEDTNETSIEQPDFEWIIKYNDSTDPKRFKTYASTSTMKLIYLYTEIPESVAVSGAPTKLNYSSGDKLDPAGLAVTVTYEDKSQHNVANGLKWIFDPETLNVGNKECDVLADFYGVSSDVYTVDGLSVSALAELDYISVTGTPDEFWKGDTFNRNGITVTAYYTDESTKDVTEDSEFSDPDMTTAGEKTVTVTYKQKEASYKIEVRTIANSQETAYTVTEAKNIIDAGKDLSTKVYVKGTVSDVVSYSSKYGSITYWLDNKAFEVYGGLNIDGKKFNSKDDIIINSDVIVYGLIKKYNGTYEFDMNNVLAYYLPASTLSISNITVTKGDAISPIITTNVGDDYTISYESDDENVVAASGSTLTTVETGTATITATLTKDGWKSSTTTFTVTVTSPSATLTSIEISGSPSKTVYSVNESFDYSGLTATGYYSDSSKQDLTDVVAWSADPDKFTNLGNITVTVTATLNEIKGTQNYQVQVNVKFSQTYVYGLNGWTLTNYTDKKDYYLVPSGSDPSVATISGIFSDKTIISDVIVTLNVATYGSGTNPEPSTFSIYNSSDCESAVTATQGGTLPTSATYTDVTYTIEKSNASSLTSDIAIKITKPGKQIRLKSIKVEFSYE